MTKYEDSFVLKDEVTKSLRKINEGLENFNGKLKGAEVQLADFQKKTEMINKFGKGMQDFGNKMTVGVTLPIIGAMTYASKMGMEFQDAEMRLQTMLGSAEKGTKMFNDIVEMGAQTPFEAKDLLRASTLMLNFGVETKKVLPYMSMLGDISGGNAERFQSLALAFSQVSANGKLQGQDLLQMVNAGFNPLQIISEKTGKSMMQLRDEMSEGQITIDKVVQAMEWATGEGGRFNNMMQKMSKTASGKLSTMMDNFNMSMAKLGEVLLPYVTKGVEVLTAFFEKFAALSPKTQKMILKIAAIAAVLGPLITILGTLITSITSIYGALTVLAPLIPAIAAAATGAAAPFILWAGAIMGVVAALSALGIALNHAKEMMRIKNMDSIRTDNLSNENLQKLSYEYQMTGNKKNFEEKYGRNVTRAVQNYSKTTNNNSSTTNNFYGNMSLSGSSNLDKILNNGQNVPLFAR